MSVCIHSIDEQSPCGPADGTSSHLFCVQDRDSLVSVGRCKHYTTHAHVALPRTRDFSRVAQDLSHRVNRNLCVSQNSHLTSSTVCHAALFHFPPAPQSDLLSCHQPDLRCCLLHTEIFPATIHQMSLSATWPNRTPLQFSAASGSQR